MVGTNLEKLKDARNKIAEVYESEATNGSPDNGNLSSLNNAVLNINIAIKYLAP